MGMLTVRQDYHWKQRAVVLAGVEIGGAAGAGKGIVEQAPSFSSCAFPRVGRQELISGKDVSTVSSVRVNPFGGKLSRLVRERYRGLTLEQNACAKLLLPSVRHALL